MATYKVHVKEGADDALMLYELAVICGNAQDAPDCTFIVKNVSQNVIDDVIAHPNVEKVTKLY